MAEAKTLADKNQFKKAQELLDAMMERLKKLKILETSDELKEILEDL